MENVMRSIWVAMLAALVFLFGCMKVTPPSGPAGTYVCFSNPPPEPYCGGFTERPWIVKYYVNAEFFGCCEYCNAENVHIPDQVRPGDTVLISVYGCIPFSTVCWNRWGSFQVTEDENVVDLSTVPMEPDAPSLLRCMPPDQPRCIRSVKKTPSPWLGTERPYSLEYRPILPESRPLSTESWSGR